MTAFSEMNDKMFPHHIDDAMVEAHSKVRCNSKHQKEDFKSPFSEKLALQQHRMVIDLALGRWKR